MSAVKTEVAVGAGVVAIAVGFLIYAGQVSGLSASTAGYPLTASFRSLEGVSVGTDVRLAGVKIGSVTGISLNPQTFRADTEFTVLSGIELPDDSAIVVSSEGLLGGNFVEILPGGSPFNLEAGAEIEDTQSSVSLVGLLMKFVAGGDSE
ncbi:outer membrane lipid asymmetry maintenance protein MlaD [Shimia thalassica]|uniref:outer membrane lipid asymmetry maintenance protein MlaD n=1 Tax=Shimia thalassica TaxID=1715693 RepID=UPI0026E3B673|nr:outer membrane lipid asymmetry maintenance protein MlaD [Shimia thalassica]MDO6797242.1 outer membrane lipid asymmetry maintenance protein MlaD [Shimia thalassica]